MLQKEKRMKVPRNLCFCIRFRFLFFVFFVFLCPQRTKEEKKNKRNGESDVRKVEDKKESEEKRKRAERTNEDRFTTKNCANSNLLRENFRSVRTKIISFFGFENADCSIFSYPLFNKCDLSTEPSEFFDSIEPTNFFFLLYSVSLFNHTHKNKVS